jgi:hypothetical protein
MLLSKYNSNNKKVDDKPDSLTKNITYVDIQYDNALLLDQLASHYLFLKSKY